MPDTGCSHGCLLREGQESLANILGQLITEGWKGGLAAYLRSLKMQKTSRSLYEWS